MLYAIKPSHKLAQKDVSSFLFRFVLFSVYYIFVVYAFFTHLGTLSLAILICLIDLQYNCCFEILNAKF